MSTARPFSSALLVAALSSFSLSALAEEPAAAPATTAPVVAAPAAPAAPVAVPAPAAPVAASAPELPNWSFGGGISFAQSTLVPVVYGGAPWGVLGGLNFATLAGVLAPGLSLSGEGRLSATNWVLVIAQYSHYGSHDDVDTALDSTSDSGALTAGVRHVFGTSHGVEISGYGAATGMLSSVVMTTRSPSFAVFGPNGQPSPAPAPTAPVEDVGRARAAHLDFGLVLDRQLVDGLGVRLASGIVGATWTWSEATHRVPDVEPTTTKGHGFNIGVQLRPSLELRMFF